MLQVTEQQSEFKPRQFDATLGSEALHEGLFLSATLQRKKDPDGGRC